MKIYLIEFNECSYDEYDAFLVVAENEDAAMAHLKNVHSPDSRWGGVNWAAGYNIEEIEPEHYTEATIIIDSYNAG